MNAAGGDVWPCFPQAWLHSSWVNCHWKAGKEGPLEHKKKCKIEAFKGTPSTYASITNVMEMVHNVASPCSECPVLNSINISGEPITHKKKKTSEAEYSLFGLREPLYVFHLCVRVAFALVCTPVFVCTAPPWMNKICTSKLKENLEGSRAWKLEIQSSHSR